MYDTHKMGGPFPHSKNCKYCFDLLYTTLLVPVG